MKDLVVYLFSILVAISEITFAIQRLHRFHNYYRHRRYSLLVLGLSILPHLYNAACRHSFRKGPSLSLFRDFERFTQPEVLYGLLIHGLLMIHGLRSRARRPRIIYYHSAESDAHMYTYVLRARIIGYI